MNNDIEDYINHLMFERRLPENSYKAYKRDLHYYKEFLKEKRGKYLTNDIITEDIIKYLEYLNSNKMASTSIARKLTAIKNFHNYLFLRKKIDTNVSSMLERPKLEKRLPNVLTVEEVDMLLDINLRTVFDYRNKAMLELLYGTGFRISELLNLKMLDIDFENCVVRCLGKGSKERIIPIGEYIIDSLNEYLERRPILSKNKRSEYIFLNSLGGSLNRVSFFKILKKMLNEKGIKKDVSPHALRHSFATHMIEYGADLRSVQELLGHADISTTRIYTHITNNKVKKDYNNFHPRS